MVEIKKWRDDKHINATTYQCMVEYKKGPVFKPKRFDEIQVGDVLKIVDGETFPCDCILLNTVDENG